MNLNLTPVHVKHKKQIGRVRGSPVWEVLTTGGLYMDILARDGSFEVIGTGPHQALARHIAEQKQPMIEWIELSKSDFLDYVDYAFLIPKYSMETEEVNRRFHSLQE